MTTEEENPKKKHALDKIFMGAVIGGAIGSVLGASIAPKKGKETRKEIVEAIKNTGKNSKKLFQRLKDFFSFKKKKNEEPSHQNSQPHATIPTEKAGIRKIPNEDFAERQP